MSTLPSVEPSSTPITLGETPCCAKIDSSVSGKVVAPLKFTTTTEIASALSSRLRSATLCGEVGPSKGALPILVNARCRGCKAHATDGPEFEYLYRRAHRARHDGARRDGSEWFD